MGDKSAQYPSGAVLSRPVSVQDRSLGSPSDVALSVSKAALGTLKDVLDAVDGVPCVRYLASVGIKILEIMEVSHMLPSDN